MQLRDLYQVQTVESDETECSHSPRLTDDFPCGMSCFWDFSENDLRG